eukprot:TRINITY_DN10883_c0_g1_i1.p1 TRINITY_DN10883_c0_g1~~TRINITY_DN10883_c0_g1_i1.p1  ORF type:complete len:320 (-),score=95.77 TRINITY_DN10883_c0_g1_i1:19-936(-)
MFKTLFFFSLSLVLSFFISSALSINFNSKISSSPSFSPHSTQRWKKISSFNHSNWDATLKKYLTQGTIDDLQVTVVNYKLLREEAENDNDVFNLYLNDLENLNCANYTDAQLFALYINAYNAFVFKMVRDNPCKVTFGRFCWPSLSIRDMGGMGSEVWDLTIGRIGKQDYTLEKLSNTIRKMQDPRIHSCIVLGAVSSPDLNSFAYLEGQIEDQKDFSIRSFLNNTQKGLKLDKENKIIYLSPVFLWYSSDITNYKKQSVVDFVTTYAPSDVADWLRNNSVEIRYFNFDWHLNSLDDVNQNFSFL